MRHLASNKLARRSHREETCPRAAEGRLYVAVTGLEALWSGEIDAEHSSD